MADQDTSPPDEMTADRALRQHDWVTAELFLWHVLEQDPPRGALWLERFAEEARLPAAAGDAFAECALGNSELLRWRFCLAPAEQSLHSALSSFMRAGRASGNATVLDSVRYWYSQARGHGFVFPDVEAFLADQPT
jgi:hypothetical protein